MKRLSQSRCPVCNTNMSQSLKEWHYICDKCKYEASTFMPYSDDLTESQSNAIDEPSREIGLKSLRISNFNKLKNILRKLKPNGGNLLEVGCAHGWFLQVNQDVFHCTGIEPDINVIKNTKNSLKIREGYFPDALGAGEKFDIIVFNDVFEHIQDIHLALNACITHSYDDSILLINLPSSSGILYRISKVLSLIGLPSLFYRFWQKGLPSPHLHYFNKKNLMLLLKQNGYIPIASNRLDSINTNGLYNRIKYIDNTGTIMTTLTYIITAAASPLLKILPSDIIYVVARRN